MKDESCWSAPWYREDESLDELELKTFQFVECRSTEADDFESVLYLRPDQRLVYVHCGSHGERVPHLGIVRIVRIVRTVIFRVPALIDLI